MGKGCPGEEPMETGGEGLCLAKGALVISQ